MNFKKYLTVKNITCFVLLILAVILFAHVSRIIMIFFAAFVLACSLNPLVNLLSKKMNRSLAVILTLVGVTAIFLAIILPIIIIAMKQINSVLQIIPAHINMIKHYILNKEIMGEKLFTLLDIPSFIQPVSAFTTHVVNSSISITIELATACIYGLTMCIVTYYFMMDRKIIRNAFLKLFPKSMKPKAARIIVTISRKIGGYIIALVVTMLSVGMVFTACLLLLKIDYAVLMGVITTVFDIVPVIGPAIALVICLLMCYHLSPVTILAIIASFFFAQWVENNFVRPYVFGKFLDIHPILIYFALFVTAKYLGIMGVIFAPAIAATVYVIFDELYIKPINDERIDDRSLPL